MQWHTCDSWFILISASLQWRWGGTRAGKRRRPDGGEAEAQEWRRARRTCQQEEELRAVPSGAGAARFRPPHVLRLWHDVRPRERRRREGAPVVPQELLRGNPVQGLVVFCVIPETPLCFFGERLTNR